MTPAKPPSPFRQATRAVILGISLGMGAFILTALLKFQLVTLLTTLVGPSDSVLMWALMRLGIEQVGTLLVAPVIAYGAGLVLTGPRWTIVSAQNLSFQLTSMAVLASPLGLETYADPLELGLVIGFTAVGIALSGWAMKRGQRATEGKQKEVQGAPPPAPLASIDFNQVKPPASVAPSAEPPASGAAPAAAPEALSTPVAPAAEPAVPAASVGAPAEPAAPAAEPAAPEPKPPST